MYPVVPQIHNPFQRPDKTKQYIKQYTRQTSFHTAEASCRLLTKELIRAKKHRARLEHSKALFNSLSMQLDEQMATLKITGILQKSTMIMKNVNELIHLPEFTSTMMTISKEMMKAGVFEEMVSDALDMENVEPDVEETEEVDKILYEITNGLLGSIESTPTTQINPIEEVEQDETSLEFMRHRLEALRN
ncbi:hypothetical protein PCK2_000177 [Pneumocystis canis]|nr:hypothetical protein PCK2_000177 [Pneumocystis canis]